MAAGITRLLKHLVPWCLLILLADAQSLSLSRPLRPPRNFGAASMAGSPATPFSITTNTVWGGIQNQTYSFTLASSGGKPPVNWSVTSGTLPTGLTLSAGTGVLSGTPSAAGTFTFTIKASDATIGDGATVTSSKTFTVIISPSDTNYGNVGDPYATEGGGPNPSAVLLSGCQDLNGNTSYRLTQNVSAATPGTVCFNLWGTNIKFDLGGKTVTGRVNLNANANAVSIFNGNINCNWPDNGGNAGCLVIGSSNSFTAPLKLHHLTIRNSAVLSRGFHLDWPLPTPSTVPTIRLYNVDILVGSQPNVARSYAVSILATNHYAEVFNNNLTCTPGANACQGISCGNGMAECKLHHNRLDMQQRDQATAPEPGRALSFDLFTANGEGWNNLVLTNNHRAVRIRDSKNIRIHDNTFQNITGGASAVHLGDPDVGSNDLNALIDHNRFEGGSADFWMIFARGVTNTIVENNTVVCTGSCNLGIFANVRAVFNDPNAKTEILLRNNSGVTLAIAPPQITVQAGSKAMVCNTGQATGAGVIENVTCPPPE
jgi:hypothetical protein